MDWSSEHSEVSVLGQNLVLLLASALVLASAALEERLSCIVEKAFYFITAWHEHGLEWIAD